MGVACLKFRVWQALQSSGITPRDSNVARDSEDGSVVDIDGSVSASGAMVVIKEDFFVVTSLERDDFSGRENFKLPHSDWAKPNKPLSPTDHQITPTNHYRSLEGLLR